MVFAACSYVIIVAPLSCSSVSGWLGENVQFMDSLFKRIKPFELLNGGEKPRKYTWNILFVASCVQRRMCGCLLSLHNANLGWEKSLGSTDLPPQLSLQLRLRFLYFAYEFTGVLVIYILLSLFSDSCLMRYFC